MKFPYKIIPETVYEVSFEWKHEDIDEMVKVNNLIKRLKVPKDVNHQWEHGKHRFLLRNNDG